MPFVPDVIVAGAGPVGLTAALSSAEAGVRVMVVDKRAGLSAASLASTLHPPTLEILDDLGVLTPVMHLGQRAETIQYRDPDGVFATFDMGDLVGRSRFPFRLHLEQSHITPVMLERLRESPRACVRFGCAVTGVVQDASGVAVTLGDGRVVRAGWLLAADGARSTVREALGIGFEGVDYPDRILRVITTDDLDRVLPGIAPVTYLFNGARSVSFLRMRDCWRIILRVPGDVPEAVALDEAWIAARFGALIPGVPLPRVVGKDTYGASRRVASRFREGRVVLMGDAAHVTSTRGGMNMNCGVHDAAALAAVIAGGGDVDAVATARHDVATRLLIPRTDRTVSGGAAWTAHLRETARDPQAAIAYLHGAAMLDMLDRTPVHA